jgi:hypothetical protein
VDGRYGSVEGGTGNMVESIVPELRGTGRRVESTFSLAGVQITSS